MKEKVILVLKILTAVVGLFCTLLYMSYIFPIILTTPDIETRVWTSITVIVNIVCMQYGVRFIGLSAYTTYKGIKDKNLYAHL